MDGHIERFLHEVSMRGLSLNMGLQDIDEDRVDHDRTTTRVEHNVIALEVFGKDDKYIPFALYVELGRGPSLAFDSPISEADVDMDVESLALFYKNSMHDFLRSKVVVEKTRFLSIIGLYTVHITYPSGNHEKTVTDLAFYRYLLEKMNRNNGSICFDPWIDP